MYGITITVPVLVTFMDQVGWLTIVDGRSMQVQSNTHLLIDASLRGCVKGGVRCMSRVVVTSASLIAKYVPYLVIINYAHLFSLLIYQIVVGGAPEWHKYAVIMNVVCSSRRTK